MVVCIEERRNLQMVHLLPFFGGRRAATITTEDINRYVVKRQTEQGASNGTINRELAALQRAYTLAVEAGLLMRGSTPHIQKLKASNVRTEFFEHEQFTAIHGHLPDHVKAVAAVAANDQRVAFAGVAPSGPQWRRHAEA